MCIGLHIDNIFTIVVVAGSAGCVGVGTQAEDDETLVGGQDGIVFLSAIPIGVVLLAELALLELDGVAGEIDFLALLFELTDGSRTTHELGGVFGLLVIVGHLGGEGVLLLGGGVNRGQQRGG